MNLAEMCERVRVSPSNASSKSGCSGMRASLYRGWCPPSRQEENPLAWMIEVNGLPVDARMMPREVQEEAYRLDLIPYVP